LGVCTAERCCGSFVFTFELLHLFLLFILHTEAQSARGMSCVGKAVLVT
jgi:hypothetical protein